MSEIRFDPGINQTPGPQPYTQKANRPEILEFPKPEAELAPRPHIITPGRSFARNRAASQVIKAYLETSEDPLSDASRIQTARLISEKMGLSIDYVFENYDRITEEISGISNNPQKFGEFVSNQWKAGNIMVDKARLSVELLNNPDSNRRPFIEQELEDLNREMPPFDASDKGILARMVGGTANMIPYSWAVSKYVVPGAALTLLSKGLAGKEVVVAGLALAASLTSAAGVAVSYEQSYELAQGIIFEDMIGLVDAEGNKVNEEYARMVTKWSAVPYAAAETLVGKLRLTGSGVLSNALKKLGKKGLEKMIQRAAFKTIGELAVNGTLKKGVSFLAGVGGAALANLTEEVVGEVIQDIYIERTALDMAKNFTNELENTVFVDYTDEENKAATVETIKATLEGAFLLQFGNMVRSGMQSVRRVSQAETKVEEDQALRAEDEVIKFADTATDEEFDEQVRVWAREEDSQELKKPVFSVTEEAVKAQAEDGSSIGTVEYTLDEEGNVLIDERSLEEGVDIEVADNMVDAIKEKFPGRVIVEQAELPPEDLIGRTLQDRDPVIREYNKIIDDIQTEIESSGKVIEDLDSQIQTIQSAVDSTEDKEEKLELLERLDDLNEDREFAQIDLDTGLTALERNQEEKSAFLKTDPKPEFEMDSQEFRDANPINNIRDGDFIQTKKGKALDKIIRESTPILTPEESAGIVKILELRANKLEVSPEKYIRDRLEEEIVAQPGDSDELLSDKRKAGIVFGRDGKAVIHVSNISDFSSWVHELAHLFRRELDEKEIEIASKWTRTEVRKQLAEDMAQAMAIENRLEIARITKELEILETGEWTREMEEVFAEGYETYIWEGKTDQKGMEPIFQKFAEYMRKIYDHLRDAPHLTKEMKMLFDGLLSDERLEALDNGSAEAFTRENSEGKLFQPDNKFDSMPEEVEKEVETFGITYNINEAGYVLPDGRMLDFSSRNQSEGYTRKGDVYIADGRDFLAGIRVTPHEQIGPEIKDFLDMGGMRISARDRVADIGSRPTSEQYKALEEIAFRGEILIEMADGSRKDYIISSGDFKKIKGQIERFYAGDSINRSALFQPKNDEYTKKIKEAVAKGYDVPIKVLKQFSKEQWAVAEIEKRTADANMLSDFDWLTEMAQGIDTYEQFKDEATFGTEDVGDKWLKNFYEVARQQVTTIDINKGNKRWIKQLTDKYIRDSIIAMSRNVKKARDAGVPVSIVAQAERYKTKKTINDAQIDLIRKIYRNNPARMREFVGEFGGDKTELKRIQKEREFAKDFEIVDESKRPEPFAKNRYKVLKDLEDVRLQGKVRDGSLTVKEIDDLLEESEKVIRDDNEQIKQLTKEFAKTKSEAVKAAIKKTKDERNKHYKDRDAKRKLKQHVRDLGKYIARPVPSTVAIEQRLTIEALRKNIDPNFRTHMTIAKREIDKVLAGDLTARELGITQKKLDSLNKKSLGEISVEELEGIKNQIKGLINVGRAIKAARKEARETKDLAFVEAFKQAMTKGEPVPDQPAFVAEKKNLKDLPQEFYLGNMRVARIADMMDGGVGLKGGDFKGPIHGFFVLDFDTAADAELREFFKRRDAWTAKYEALGLTTKELNKEYEVSGLKITAAEIAGVYAFYKNDKARGHVEFGNGITENMRNEMVRLVPDKVLRMADYMVEDFGGGNFERLRDARRVAENRETKHEENYMPIHTLSMFVTGVGAELNNRDFKRKTLKKDFLIERKNISEESHKAIGGIELDIFSTWESDVRDHEHYIGNAEILARANRILANSDFKAAANATGFKLHVNELQNYTNRVANPSINKSHTVWNRAVRHLRRATSISYLSFNVVTMMKQAPSIALFSGYANPAELLSGIYQTITAFGQTREIMERLAPQMRERSIERYIDELKRSANKDFLKIVEKVGLAGMRGIIRTDQFVVTAGWKAVFDKNVKGMSEENAARIATRAVLNTQPASSAKDVARIYSEDNFLSVFLQFTNQLNQIFNIATYDAPQALLHHHFGKMSGLYIGLTVSALAMWIIANRRLPRDDEDYWEVFRDQVMNSLPVFGRVASSEIDGFNYTLPIITPITKGVQGLSLAEKLFRGEGLTEKQTERMIFNLYESVATGVGIPYIGPKRVYEGIQNKKPLQYIIFGGEAKDD